MHSKVEVAASIFSEGYNCAQTVLGAFCTSYGMDVDTARCIACGLGSGARSAELCGAVSGAILVIGLKYGQNKEQCNIKTEEFVEQFKQKNSSIVCRDILGCDISNADGRNQAVSKNLYQTLCLNMVISASTILERLDY